MSEWQPIETAPKDGTPVDLWIQIYETRGYRATGCEYRDSEWQHYSLPEFGHSIELCHVDWQHLATHWMPMPEPPKGNE